MKSVRPISAPKRHRGFSLIELMVGVGIGLVITLAVFQVLTASEARKRTSTGLNDASQSGNYALYVLDRMLRSAGTGYSQGWATVGGCRLNAALPGGESLPRVGPLPAPFTAIPQTFRLAPVVIFRGASDTGTDVIMVMSGATGYGEVLTNVPAGGVAATQVALPNTIGYRAGDLVMLASGGECLLSQVDAAKPACAGIRLRRWGQPVARYCLSEAPTTRPRGPICHSPHWHCKAMSRPSRSATRRPIRPNSG